jgi:hypothetical protein
MDKPALPPHNTKFSISTKEVLKSPSNPFKRNAHLQSSDELEALVIEINYLDNAPFSWVRVTIFFGNKYTKPRCNPIDKKYGDLGLSIEINGQDIRNKDLNELKTLFKIAGLKSLIHAGKKYNRPIERLEKELQILEKTYPN